MNRKSCPKRISQTAIGSYRDSFNKIMFNFLSKSTSIVQTCHFYLKMWFQISAILVFYAEQLSVFTMIDLLPLLDNVLFIKPVEKSNLIFAKIMAHNKLSILWKYKLLNYKHCLSLKEASACGATTCKRTKTPLRTSFFSPNKALILYDKMYCHDI